jgi:hypothetical protein
MVDGLPVNLGKNLPSGTKTKALDFKFNMKFTKAMKNTRQKVGVEASRALGPGPPPSSPNQSRASFSQMELKVVDTRSTFI